MAPYPTQKCFRTGSEFPPTTPGRLRIYSMRFCPFAQRTRLVLAHKNIEFETVNIDLKNKPEWFFTKNPLGLVPVLELDDKIVYESTAASEWLDDVYPQNRLTPSDPYRKAKDRMLLEYEGKLTACYYGLFLKKDEAEKEKLREEIHKHYKFYNDELALRGSKFFGGDQLAMIDLYLWPHFERLVTFVQRWEPSTTITKERCPNLFAWVQAMYETPAVKATAFDADIHEKFSKTVLDGKPDYDILL